MACTAVAWASYWAWPSDDAAVARNIAAQLCQLNEDRKELERQAFEEAAGMLAARSLWGRRLGIDRGRVGRVFAWLMVAGFAPLLFHAPFMWRVIIPLLAAVGAI